jgi:hypothetical protein
MVEIKYLLFHGIDKKMKNDVLRTSADDLYELVRSKKKISVEDAAKLLKIPPKTVQALVDFLVEEKIFGIEYKFTTPYVYLSQEKPRKKLTFEGSFRRKVVSKEEFFQKAQRWNVSMEKINGLWSEYVKENFQFIKGEFYRKARAKNIPDERVDSLWRRYIGYLR